MSDFSIVNFLIEKSGGLIKDESQANIVLGVLASILFLISGVILFNTFATPSTPAIDQGPPIIEQVPGAGNQTPSSNSRR